MSKFDYANFTDGYDELAVSKEKYTKEEAIEIAKAELKYVLKKRPYLKIGDGYVRHRAGRSEDNEPCVCWWLEYEEYKRSCPCWVFHASENNDRGFRNEYEVIREQEK